MQVRGPLMIEHRLIERMLAVVDQENRRLRREREVDPKFVETAVDFFRMYADRTHHGKEEDIYFRTLKAKPLNDSEARLMAELIEEHRYARQIVGELEEAGRRVEAHREEALDQVEQKFQSLLDFYPRHIAKEDKTFFPAAMKYFTDEENEHMLAEFWEFDRTLIHEKYRTQVQHWEEAGKTRSAEAGV